jgi:hypothetical protein
MVANALEASSLSGDGSFTLAEGTATTGNAQTYDGFSWMRCDDQEDGDVFPFVWMSEVASSDNYSGTTRTVANVYSSSNSVSADFFRLGAFIASTLTTIFRGWRRRSFASGDAWQQFQGAVLESWNGNSLVGNSFLGSQDRIACTFLTQNGGPVVREPVWVVSIQVGQKMRKGTLRWAFASLGGSGNNLCVNKTYVQLSGDNSSTGGPVAIGPWDGSTVPYNS